MKLPSLLLSLLLMLVCQTNAAEESAPAASDEAEAARFAAFEKQLTNAALVGQFTIQGQANGAGRKEEYIISSVTKIPGGDFWMFKARMKYGGTDVTLPMPLEVKWAGDTPIITLTETTLPGLGTFSARVVIHAGQYAGVWKHGKYGGQMFGEIKKVDATE